MPGYKVLEDSRLDEVYTSEYDESAGRSHELGEEIHLEDGRIFRFVEINQDGDVSAGNCLSWADPSNHIASVDTSGDANGYAGTFAGVAHIAATPSTDSENKFLWVQVGGDRVEDDLVDASNGITDGAFVTPDETNDGEFILFSAGAEHKVCVFADSAASGGTFSGMIQYRKF